MADDVTCAHCLAPWPGHGGTASNGDRLHHVRDDGMDCYTLVTRDRHPMPCDQCSTTVAPAPATPDDVYVRAARAYYAHVPKTRHNDWDESMRWCSREAKFRAAVDAAREDLAAQLAKARREIETAHAVAVSNKRALGAAFEAQEQAEAERDQARKQLAEAHTTIRALLGDADNWQWGTRYQVTGGIHAGTVTTWRADEADARNELAWLNAARPGQRHELIRRPLGPIQTVTEEDNRG